MNISVVQTGSADIDANVFSRQRRRRDMGVFKGLPNHFQKQALLRIDLRSLAWRYAEDGGIEIDWGVKKSAGKGLAKTGLIASRMQKSFSIPTAYRAFNDRASRFV